MKKPKRPSKAPTKKPAATLKKPEEPAEQHAAASNSSSSSSNVNTFDNATSVKSLTLKDYLETATDASGRTRFITIVMVVASVLVLVSVLNSADNGWITARLNKLADKTSDYTVEKFPLLCKCDKLVEAYQIMRCQKLEKLEENKILMGEVTQIDEQLKAFKDEYFVNINQQELIKRREAICGEERNKLRTLYEALQKSAAETKYTVRVPFFGVAFDINDIALLGGLSLWIILILLRLSLRTQILSLRIAFKKARESGQEDDFYEILAVRQTFIFPPLRDENQKPFYGWIEQVWRRPIGKIYHYPRGKLLKWLKVLKTGVMKLFKIKEELMAATSHLQTVNKEGPLAPNPNDNPEIWQANRNITLRIVPQALSLLPFFIFVLQFVHDMKTLGYGNELSPFRTRWLVISSSFLLLNILVLGLWCITKWNELDKLWDDYDDKRGKTSDKNNSGGEIS